MVLGASPGKLQAAAAGVNTSCWQLLKAAAATQPSSSGHPTPDRLPAQYTPTPGDAAAAAAYKQHAVQASAPLYCHYSTALL
jgi:hypothetical protein